MTPYFVRDGITIYNADCMDVLPALSADDFAVMLTDPPYGQGYKQGRRVNGQSSGWTSRWTDVSIEGDATTDCRDEALAWWGDRPALVFGTWKRTPPSGVREVLVWDKVVSTGMGALDVPWRPSWESVYVLGSGFVGARGHGVLRHSLPTLAQERKWHPTPKPLALIHDLLAKCPPGAVIDPFMGSGPVAQACHELGRRYIGIELVEDYCRIAVSRLRQQTFDFGGDAA
jgi:DNA modification methylase